MPELLPGLDSADGDLITAFLDESLGWLKESLAAPPDGATVGQVRLARRCLFHGRQLAHLLKGEEEDDDADAMDYLLGPTTWQQVLRVCDGDSAKGVRYVFEAVWMTLRLGMGHDDLVPQQARANQ